MISRFGAHSIFGNRFKAEKSEALSLSRARSKLRHAFDKD